MKIVEGLEIKKVLGHYVVIATGALSETFHGVIKLNQTGYEIWELVAKGFTEEQIASFLVSKYSINELKAKSDVHMIIQQMKNAGVIENNGN